MWNTTISQKWLSVIFHEYFKASIIPKFLSAIAWFTKENLIANRMKAAIPMIAMWITATDLFWTAPIPVFITHTRIAQKKNNMTRIIRERTSTPIILMVSFLVSICQKSLNPRSSFFAQPRINGTNIAAVSRFVTLVIRSITSFVVSVLHPRNSVPMAPPIPKRIAAKTRTNPIKNTDFPFHFVRDISRPNDLSSWRIIFWLFCMSIK